MKAYLSVAAVNSGVRHQTGRTTTWANLASTAIKSLLFRKTWGFGQVAGVVSGIIGVVAAVFGALVATFGPQLLGKLSISKRLIKGIVASTVGTILFLLSWTFLFDRANCPAVVSVGCIANKNGGMIALTALVVAVVSIWLNISSEERDNREKERSRQLDRNEAVRAVASEVTHNLIHVAIVTKNEKIEQMPQLNIDELRSFVERKIHLSVGRKLERSARAVLRNYDSTIEAQSPPNPSALPSSVDVNRSLEDFTMNCISLLLRLRDSEFKEQLDLHSDILRALDQFLQLADSQGNGRFAFTTSERKVDETESKLRSLGQPLLCWVNGKNREGVRTIEMKPLFYTSGTSDSHKSTSGRNGKATATGNVTATKSAIERPNHGH